MNVRHETLLAMRPREESQRLLAWRVRLRQYNHWLEEELVAYGLTFQQFQLLISVNGHPGADAPTIGDLAAYLLLRPHSTFGLVERTEAAGFVLKRRDNLDARVVRVIMTDLGHKCMNEMAPKMLERLKGLAKILNELVASQA